MIDIEATARPWPKTENREEGGEGVRISDRERERDKTATPSRGTRQRVEKSVEKVEALLCRFHFFFDLPLETLLSLASRFPSADLITAIPLWSVLRLLSERERERVACLDSRGVQAGHCTTRRPPFLPFVRS